MIEDVQPTNNILVIEGVFETTDDLLATAVQDRLQTVEGQEALRVTWVRLAKSTLGLSYAVRAV